MPRTSRRGRRASSVVDDFLLDCNERNVSVFPFLCDVKRARA